jgi:hypothetical protein
VHTKTYSLLPITQKQKRRRSGETGRERERERERTAKIMVFFVCHVAQMWNSHLSTKNSSYLVTADLFLLKCSKVDEDVREQINMSTYIFKVAN